MSKFMIIVSAMLSACALFVAIYVFDQWFNPRPATRFEQARQFTELKTEQAKIHQTLLEIKQLIEQKLTK